VLEAVFEITLNLEIGSVLFFSMVITVQFIFGQDCVRVENQLYRLNHFFETKGLEVLE
jgi:hypothetical protein